MAIPNIAIKFQNVEIFANFVTILTCRLLRVVSVKEKEGRPDCV